MPEGCPSLKWSAEDALTVMDDNEIAAGIVSVSTPGVHRGDDTEARSMARADSRNAEYPRSRHDSADVAPSTETRPRPRDPKQPFSMASSSPEKVSPRDVKPIDNCRDNAAR